MKVDPDSGLLDCARQLASPNFDQRPQGVDIDLLVLHCISLPPGEFGGPWIDRLFTNDLPAEAHPYFEQIHQMRVSAHLLIDRQGGITQYVAFDKRAWHAGQSCHDERSNCNDFAIGIELEGTDEQTYTDQQYQRLAEATKALMQTYPAITPERIVAHSDIAPERKTDPGPGFDWQRLRQMLDTHSPN